MRNCSEKGAEKRESGKAGKWESGKAGKRESGKAGKRESGKAGKRESGKAGKRESGIRTTPSVPDPISCVIVCAGSSYLRACLHGGGGPQVGDVTCLGGVTCLSIESLILTWSRLHDRWGEPPHVTSPIWGPPLPCKQALSLVVKSCTTLARIVEYCDNRKALTGRENDFQVRDLRLRRTTPGVRVEFGETPPTSTRWSLTT